MSIIYNVTIEPAGKEDLYRVTWHDEGNNRINSYEQVPEITIEDTLRLSRMAKFQLGIGQKLFRFLDGQVHDFQQALDRAHRKAEVLQLNLNTCRQTHDWPFELLADKTFLLPQKIDLVRCAPTRGKEKTGVPRDRPLKLLFMACSALDIKPELDFEREEEAIFQITENLPIDMDVEDSGTLEGLRGQLEQEQYDVVHLSGHTGIAKNGRPYFIMEDETGNQHQVHPYRLWNEALIENPPRLLFLSGSRTGKARDRHGSTETVSFAHMMKKNYNLPVVMEWGKSVRDAQAIHAGKMIYHDISRGKSILQAVRRARFDMLKKFPHTPEPAWPLLRLFGGGIASNPIVKENQPQQPKHRRIEHVYLKNSRVMVLAEGFVGRRRQIQTGLRTLKQEAGKVGVLILGTGGLGKSCLAGKLCERFTDHTLIIIHGKLNTITLQTALEDAFIQAQDQKGQQILTQKEKMTNKLTRLCAAAFKEKNYLILLDDFEQNLEGVDKGQPGSLVPEAADLLKVLLSSLPGGGKNTQLIITSRYKFSLEHQGSDLVQAHLQKIWLTGFRRAEKSKKARALKNIGNYPDQSLAPRLLAAGRGNPRLMEWIDVLVGQMEKTDVKPLLEAIKDKQEEFIRQHLVRELLRRGGKDLERLLRSLSIYREPVQLDGVRQVAIKAGLSGWEELLREGMHISLMEHDQTRRTYRVTPLLREELSRDIRDTLSCHQAAFAYYKKICKTRGAIGPVFSNKDFLLKLMKAALSTRQDIPYADFNRMQEIRDSIDPVLMEEWIYHALGCGEERVASLQTIILIFYLIEQLALQEALRVGRWTLEKKKRECAFTEDAFLLNSIAYTYKALGDHANVIEYSKRALSLFRRLFGEKHPVVTTALNSLGQGYSALGDHQNAFECFQEMMAINRGAPGETDPLIANSLNNMGYACDARGDYPEAIRYYQQAISIGEKIFGEEHCDIVSPLTNLGSVFYSQGDYPGAIRHFQRALTICRKHYEENHPHISNLLNHLAGAWSKMGRHAKAIEFLEQARAIDGKIYEDPHPEAADKLNSLGLTYTNLGEYDKAIDYIKQALTIWENAYGPKHPKISIAKNNLGQALIGQGNTKEAIGCLEQALAIDLDVYGEDHLETSAALNNLGSAFYNLGDYPKAIGYCERALDILKKTHDPKHPTIALANNNLGEMYRASGKLQKAIQYFEKALDVNKTATGQHYLHVAVTHNNLGSAYHDLADYHAAETHFQRALAISREMYGENHPQVTAAMNGLEVTRQALGGTKKSSGNSKPPIPNPGAGTGKDRPRDAATLNNMGADFFNRGDYPKAIDYYERALVILEKKQKENHPDIATALNNLGAAWRLSGEPRKAIDYFKRALVILKKALGEKHQHVAAALNNLGTTVYDQADYPAALDYFEQALTISREIHGENHPLYAAALNNIGTIQLALGRPEKTIEYCQRALDIDITVYGEIHPEVAGKLNNIGTAYFKLKQKEKAKGYFEKAYQIYNKTVGPGHTHTKNVSNFLKACG